MNTIKEIIKNDNGTSIKLTGRIDISNAITLSMEIEKAIEGSNNLILDFEEIDYISSAGLRTLLDIEKKMSNQGGSMKLVNPQKPVMDVFRMTGFDKILTIV